MTQQSYNTTHPWRRIEYFVCGEKSLVNTAISVGKSLNIELTEKACCENGCFSVHAYSKPLCLTLTGNRVVSGALAVLRCLNEISGESENLFLAASIDMWTEFGISNLGLGCTECSNIAASLYILANRLENVTFLAGANLTACDIVVASALLTHLNIIHHASIRRWFQSVSSSTAFSSVFGLHQISTPVETGGKCVEISDRSLLSSNAVVSRLFDLNCDVKVYQHAKALTVDKTVEYCGHLNGILTKNLFLHDSKHGYVLVCLRHDREASTKVIAKLMNLTGRVNLRLSNDLTSVLNIESGSVSCFAIINDTSNQVKLVIDTDLLASDVTILTHPLRSDWTCSLSSLDLKRFLDTCNHDIIQLDFSKQVSGDNNNDNNDDAKTKAENVKLTATTKTTRQADDKPASTTAPESTNETLLAITSTKEGDFGDWYRQCIVLSEMIDYSDISGCYIIRPWAYRIWEFIQEWFDREIKQLGVDNAYFPLFVSKRALETEKEHLAGFTPEVAWVTRAGSSELAEPIAVRPTSETIMYPLFSKWIHSHRDLPLKINQWCNVVRWEFKFPTPFLRSREFLWQEGHTAHSSFDDAQETVLAILELYRRVYEELLAIPVIKGQKTEKEKFAGGLLTTTVEAYIPTSGRAIQGATSHNLGQSFGKMFNIQYLNDSGSLETVWQTSWGLTTRTLGVCVMVHGDNKGLVLPPRIAPIQVVIVPVVMTRKLSMEETCLYCNRIKTILAHAGIRVKVDESSNQTAGWKYNHWEQKGVPIRLEAGPRDIASNQVTLVRRDDGSKVNLAVTDDMHVDIAAILENMQTCIFNKAKRARDDKLVRVMHWKDFVPALNQHCIVMTPFCNIQEWEEKAKAMSRDEALLNQAEDERTSTSVAAKTLCIPFDQPNLPAGTPCFVSGLPATCWILWGRSY